MEEKMYIRQENAKDHREVYGLIKEAFASAEHANGNEQDLVDALRKGEAFIPELSLVAVSDEKIVGHILFTKAKVGNEEVLVLAPLSVRPGYQRQGIGKALIREGHRIAKELGYRYALVLGSETYYPQCGYVFAGQFGIEIPEGMPPENFMAVRLQEHAGPVKGKVIYAEEFGL